MKSNTLIIIICLTVIRCKQENKEINLVNTRFVADFSQFDIAFYKLQDYDLPLNTALNFKENGQFEFEFMCTKDIYKGHYEVNDDIISISEIAIPIPNRFILKNKKEIYGEYRKDSVKYFYSFVKE